MPSKPLSGSFRACSTCTDTHVRLAAFVTGNANKLREVKEILSQGGDPIEIVSKELDGTSRVALFLARSSRECSP
jgi:hypothetical protein